MIYAIRAVGTEFVKIGITDSVGKRLKALDTGCPHELHIEAVANWPDQQESAIHLYLEEHCEKLEWFRDSEATAQVIEWIRKQEAGLRAFQVAFLKYVRAKGKMPKWLATEHPSRLRPKRSKWSAGLTTTHLPPEIPTILTDEERLKANERYEQIKQRALARKAAKRSQETLSQSTG